MTSAEAMKIGFYTEGPPFNGATPARQALGGSETALIQAARALAGRGHEVLVLNNTPEPSLDDGVRYYPSREYAPRVLSDEFDVFIVHRFFGFFAVPIRAGLTVLWNHDTLDEPKGLRAVADRIDLMFVLSQYHRDNYLTLIPEFQDRVQVTRNGLDFSLIDRAALDAVKDPHSLIYASRPERGLQILLEDLWPRLIQARPGLRLHLCGYHVPQGDLAPGLAELYGHLDRLVRRAPSVKVLGSLVKEDYYRHLAGSALMVYPCTFPEISCIAALEAQACRTPIMTTDGFALTETVKQPFFKVPGRPGSPEYIRLFIERSLELLDHPESAESLARQARGAVEADYDWDRIAADWERRFRLALAAKRSRRTERDAGAPKYGRPSSETAPTSDPPSPSSARSPLTRARLQDESLCALVLDSGYYLVREISQGLKRLGHRVCSVRLKSREYGSAEVMQDIVSRIRECRPDFLLTVNHLGFDVKGVLTGFLSSVRLPVASWFVDSPMLILPGGPGNVSDNCSVFLWDEEYLQDVRDLGFEHVHYLPLATDETVFKPANGGPNPLRRLSCRVSFVGGSMASLIRQRRDRLGLTEEHMAHIDRTAAAFAGSDDRTPARAMAAAGLTGQPLFESFSPEDRLNLEILITWRATQMYRQSLVAGLAGLSPVIVGDPEWRELLNGAGYSLRPPLDYYRDLPLFYTVSDINMNATSLQMKTGLNQRVFDVPACGSFLLTDYRAQIEPLFDRDREVVCYKNPEEAADLAAWFMKHDSARRAVISRGRDRVLAEHTYTQRLTELVGHMRRAHGS